MLTAAATPDMMGRLEVDGYTNRIVSLLNSIGYV